MHTTSHRHALLIHKLNAIVQSAVPYFPASLYSAPPTHPVPGLLQLLLQPCKLAGRIRSIVDIHAITTVAALMLLLLLRL